jgi:hypothetical protein
VSIKDALLCRGEVSAISNVRFGYEDDETEEDDDFGDPFDDEDEDLS